MTWWMPWSRPDAKTVLEREGVSPFLNIHTRLSQVIGTSLHQAYLTEVHFGYKCPAPQELIAQISKT